MTPLDESTAVARVLGWVALVAITLAPGWALDRLLGRDDRPTFVAVWVHRIGLSVAWVSWSALALAQLGRFDACVLTALALVPALVAGVRAGWRRAAGWSRPGVRDAALVALLLAISATTLWPPFEDVFGGRDNGVYVAAGIRLAKHGGIRFEDPLVRDFPAEHEGLFFRAPRPGTTGVAPRFAGFYLEDVEKGRVAPQFMPVPSLWIAILAGLLGTHAALGATLFFAVLALGWVYRTGEELDGPEVGLGAVAVVGFCVLEAWFGRSHLSEIPDQAMSFAALASAMAWARGGGRAYAVGCAASLLLAMVTRIDALLVVLPLAGALALAWLGRPGRPGERWLVGLGAALAVWVAATWATTARSYVIEVFLKNLPDHLGRFPLRVVVPAAGLGAIAAALVVARFRARLAPRVGAVLARLAVLAPFAASALVVAALYAWFVRPDWERGTQALSMVKLAGYLGPAVLAAAIAGAAVLIADPTTAPRALFLATTLPITALYVQHSRNRLDQFWEMRRFVSVPVPALALAAAFAVVWAVRFAARRSRSAGHLAAAAALAFATFAVHGLWRGAAVVRGHEEDRGALATIAAACDAIPPDALVIADSRYESPTAYLTAPIAYLCDRDVVELFPGDKPLERIAAAVEALSAQRPVWLATVGGAPLFTDRLRPAFQSSLTYRGPWMVPTLWWAPDTVDERSFAVDLFRVERGAPAPRTALEMEGAEAPWLDGFHALEVQPESGVRYRWSRDHARVYLPGYDTAHPRRIVARLASQRLRGDAPLEIALGLEGGPLTNVTVEHGFLLFEVDPAPTGGPPVLVMRAEAMAGGVAAGDADRRDLGVSIDWIAWDVPDRLDMADPRTDRVLAGFHNPEGGRGGRRRFRWTTEKASMYLPGCPSGPVEVRIDVAADVLRDGGPPTETRPVSFRIAGETYGPFVVPPGWQRLILEVPGGLRASGDATVPRVDLVSEVGRVPGAGERRVGVRVAAVEWGALAASPPSAAIGVRFEALPDGVPPGEPR